METRWKPPLAMALTQAKVTRYEMRSDNVWLCLSEIPVPRLARTAQPPDPIVPLVRWAKPKQWFHPCLLAVLPQTFIADSLKVLVSCSNRKSSDALFETLAAAEAHEFGLDVVIAQRPSFRHQRSSRVDSSGMSKGFSPRVVSGKP